MDASLRPEGSAGAGAEDTFVGTVLGETYRVVRRIGEGGMGQVYEATHERIKNRRFAIKVMHPWLCSQKELIARFLQEAETTCAVRHANVVDVNDVHRTPDGRPYIVAEFLDGEDLGERLERDRTLDERTAARVCVQVCRALGAAHAEGVIHRDLKPENVYLMGPPDDPRVKLLDFGIAKSEAATMDTRTKTGMIMGTPAYMAPEQARGIKVDGQADVYALGCILYRSLTGRLPYAYEDPSQILRALLIEEPDRPRAIRRDLSPEFELVIQTAMGREPSQRYADMAAFERALIPFTKRRATDLAPVEDTALVRPGDEIRSVRPVLLLYGTLAYLWVFAGTLELGAYLLTTLRDVPLTRTEIMLLAAGAFATLGTPAALIVRRFARTVWKSTPLSLTWARRLRAGVGAAVVTYGTAILGCHLATVLLDPMRTDIPADMRIACLGASALAGLLGFGLALRRTWVRARRAS